MTKKGKKKATKSSSFSQQIFFELLVVFGLIQVLRIQQEIKQSSCTHDAYIEGRKDMSKRDCKQTLLLKVITYVRTWVDEQGGVLLSFYFVSFFLSTKRIIFKLEKLENTL